MSIIPELASSQNRRDEEPNKALGLRLASENDLEGIREAAENLFNENRNIQADCLAVLEQVGLVNPELITDFLENFLKLAFGKDNRLIWAAMINIALIADRKADDIMGHLNEIVEVVNVGSVITRDNGIKILARTASTSPEYNLQIFPYLIDQLNTCRAKSIPQYAESILVAVQPGYQKQYLDILNNRLDELSPAQEKRVQKILKRVR